MTQHRLACAVAGILIVAGLLTACGSRGTDRATVTPSPVASSQAGQPQPASATSTAARETAGEVLYVAGDRLMLVSTDGGEPRQLIADDDLFEYETSPDWSPDGSQVAFRGMSGETFQEDIYVVDADGSNVRQLTDTPDIEQDIAWSPDGSWVAFAGMDSAAFIGNLAADGSTFLRFAGTFDHTGGPAWSPDGTEIAFYGARGGTTALYIMDDDGANLRRITDDSVPGVFQPRWSPDGSRLVFTDGGFDSMYLIDAGGTNLVSLAERGAWGLSPSWSPDGSAIAYVSSAPERLEAMYLVDLNGLNVRQLPASSGRSSGYDWSEDGSRIVWISDESSADRSGSVAWQLQIINRDGAEHRIVATRDDYMSTPKWRPTGTRVEPLPQPTWPPDLGTPVPTRTPTPPYVPTFDTSGPPWAEPDNGICEVSIPIRIAGAYLMNPDGSNVREVIGRELELGEDVVWSPDGKSVTYVGMTLPESVEAGITPTPDAAGDIPGPVYGIFQRDIASGKDTMLVAVSGAETLAWSADGTRLAFTYREYEVSTERHWISVVNGDGSDLRRIAELPAGLSDIALSYTGDQPRIAYMFDDDVWVMNVDGSDQRKLTDTPDYEYDLGWAANGDVIFRTSDGFQPDDWRDDPYLLYSIRPDGTNLRLLDPFERGDRQPSWSPDGRQVTFSHAGEIWVMNADGSDRRNMTQHLAQDTSPAWSPDGSLILFRSLFREPPGEIEEPRREPGQPRPIASRSDDAEQEGLSVAACWNAGNSRTVGGSGGAVPFPVEPLLVDADSSTIRLDFSQLGEPGTLSIAVYDLAATRANGKGLGDAAIILPCAAPGGTEERCRVLDTTYQPADTVDVDLALPAGDYVLIVKSNVVAGTEYGYVEQAFHVRISDE